MTEAPPRLGIRAYARHRTARAARGDHGFQPTSHPAVLKAIATGRIAGAVVGVGRARRIDVAKADALWLENTDPAQVRARRNGSPPPPTMVEARLEVARWDAKQRELEYHKAAGKLVDADEVKAATFEHSRRFQKRALELPDRLCQELAAESDPARVRTILMRELREACGVDAAEAEAIAKAARRAAK